MASLIGGIVILAIGAVIFWLCLPRGGVSHRLVGTEWEPYVGVAFCATVALSLTLILSGVISMQ